jgi:hypothetical protein
MSAVLLAAVTGAGGTLGGQLWAGIVSLVRRPSHGKGISDAKAAEMRSGERALLALRESPGDREKAMALAEALLARSAADPQFRAALDSWWDQAEPIRTGAGDVKNTISGGTQHGPVLQGRDFGNITFGAPPPDSPS